MAASDEFPRGISASNAAGASTVASVTLPACPGVTHVLTKILGQIIQPLSTGAAGVTTIQVSDSTLGVILQLYIGWAAGVAQGETSWDGKVQGSSGGSLTVAFFASNPNVNEIIDIEFYDY